MNKREKISINKVKKMLMEDTKEYSNDKKYREGFKHGFNLSRRIIKKALKLI